MKKRKKDDLREIRALNEQLLEELASLKRDIDRRVEEDVARQLTLLKIKLILSIL